MIGEAVKALYNSHFIPAWLLWNVQKLCNKSESNTVCWQVVLKCFLCKHFTNLKSISWLCFSGEITCHLHHKVEVIWSLDWSLWVFVWYQNIWKNWRSERNVFCNEYCKILALQKVLWAGESDHKLKVWKDQNITHTVDHF